MQEHEIPDLNIFMQARRIDHAAFSALPEGFRIRSLREDELDEWKGMPFDSDELKREYHGYMSEYFERVYAPKRALFFERCKVVTDAYDRIVGTGFLWKLRGKVDTLHWIKVVKDCEGLGIGRALLSELLRSAEGAVWLHTQPSSFRAIKLYADFGFAIVESDRIGCRENHCRAALPILREFMGEKRFAALRFCEPDVALLDAVDGETAAEF